jgi:hypothetical protein
LTNLVKLRLMPEQRAQLAPLVGEAASNHENVIFYGTAVPFFSEGETLWEFQVVRIKATAGGKIIKLIRENAANMMKMKAVMVLAAVSVLFSGCAEFKSQTGVNGEIQGVSAQDPYYFLQATPVAKWNRSR